MTQNSPDDMKIAGNFTVADWNAMKAVLKSDQSSAEIWKLTFETFFRTRIETRYFVPIRLLQKHGENEGEGFSIVALQCSLIEFLASTREGKEYKHCSRGVKCEENEYCGSGSMFSNFLRDNQPFNDHFSDLAGCFYTHVRCKLFHEARTKGNWIIRADSPKNINEIVDFVSKPGKTILYRNSLQEAFKTYINGYGEELTKCKKLQEAFIRKFDSLCEE